MFLLFFVSPILLFAFTPFFFSSSLLSFHVFFLLSSFLFSPLFSSLLYLPPPSSSLQALLHGASAPVSQPLPGSRSPLAGESGGLGVGGVESGVGVGMGVTVPHDWITAPQPARRPRTAQLSSATCRACQTPPVHPTSQTLTVYTYTGLHTHRQGCSCAHGTDKGTHECTHTGTHRRTHRHS